MPSTDLKLWVDEIPLLETISAYKGMPGGVIGCEYLYCPTDLAYEMISADPDPPPSIKVKDLEMWKWRIPETMKTSMFRFQDSKTGKAVSWQILERGEPLYGHNPGSYRCPTFVVCGTAGILAQLDWQDREHELLGTLPPAKETTGAGNQEDDARVQSGQAAQRQQARA